MLKNKKIKQKLKKYFLGLLGILFFILVWEILSKNKNTAVLPDIKYIGKSLIQVLSSQDFSIHFKSSMKILFFGIMLAVGVGFILGVLLAEFRLFDYFLSPVFNSIRGVAGISLYPVLIVIFGLSDMSKIFIVFWTAFPSILIAAYRNILTIEKELLEAGSVFGIDRFHMLTKVKIPLAISGTMNGIKIGVGSGWVSLVVAEMLGATKGLGFMLSFSANTFNFDNSFSYIIIISLTLGILTSIINFITYQIERRLFN